MFHLRNPRCDEAALLTEPFAVTMMIEADPDAAGFYRLMGAADDGIAPSGSIRGRLLPRLRVQL
jgi:hypothetical protein